MGAGARALPNARAAGQEGPHVERGLASVIATVIADRTGGPRETTPRHASVARRAGDVGGASRHLEACRTERFDRAGPQARLFGAAVAWIGSGRRERHLEVAIEGKGAAVAVPQAEIRMDQNAERRDENGFCAAC